MAKEAKITLFEQVRERLRKLLPPSPITVEMTCPSLFQMVDIPYYKSSYLFETHDRNYIFLLKAKQDAISYPTQNFLRQSPTPRAVQESKETLRKIPNLCLAVLVPPRGKKFHLVGKESSGQLQLNDLTISQLLSTLRTNIETKSNNNESPPTDFELTAGFLENLHANQAPELAQKVNWLVHNQKSNQQMDNHLWQQIVYASLRILPEVSKTEPKLAIPAIESLAKTIIFLSAIERFNAVKQLLKLALEKDVNSDTRERLSSVAYAIGSSLRTEDLLQLISIIRQRLSPNEKVPSSLAQLMSLAQARSHKQ